MWCHVFLKIQVRSKISFYCINDSYSISTLKSYRKWLRHEYFCSNCWWRSLQNRKEIFIMFIENRTPLYSIILPLLNSQIMWPPTQLYLLPLHSLSLPSSFGPLSPLLLWAPLSPPPLGPSLPSSFGPHSPLIFWAPLSPPPLAPFSPPPLAPFSPSF